MGLDSVAKDHTVDRKQHGSSKAGLVGTVEGHHLCPSTGQPGAMSQVLPSRARGQQKGSKHRRQDLISVSSSGQYEGREG